MLTRLPGGGRVDPAAAARLLVERFAPPLLVRSAQRATYQKVLSELGIAGGAVYDALVAIAAAEHLAQLATRDLRARDTYGKVGARIVIAA